MENFRQFCDQLENKIESAYQNGTTVEQAERLAGEFLYAQMQVSKELANVDLDSRMKKSAVKGVKAAIYMENATKGEKKPTEAMLTAIIDSHEVVQQEQDALDKAEVSKYELERYYDIFLNAHIFFRGVAKGKFE